MLTMQHTAIQSEIKGLKQALQGLDNLEKDVEKDPRLKNSPKYSSRLISCLETILHFLPYEVGGVKYNEVTVYRNKCKTCKSISQVRIYLQDMLKQVQID